MVEFGPVFHTYALYHVDLKIAMLRYCRNEKLLGDRHPIAYLMQSRACTFVNLAFSCPVLKVSH